MSTREPVNIDLKYAKKATYEFSRTYTLDPASAQDFLSSSFFMTVDMKDTVQVFPLSVSFNSPKEVVLTASLTVADTDQLFNRWSCYSVTEEAPSYTHTWQYGHFLRSGEC